MLGRTRGRTRPSVNQGALLGPEVLGAIGSNAGTLCSLDGSLILDYLETEFNKLALFDGTGFLVQEIGGVFGILVIWVITIRGVIPRKNRFNCTSLFIF